jgi:hypothetical protein
MWSSHNSGRCVHSSRLGRTVELVDVLDANTDHPQGLATAQEVEMSLSISLSQRKIPFSPTLNASLSGGRVRRLDREAAVSRMRRSRTRKLTAWSSARPRLSCQRHAHGVQNDYRMVAHLILMTRTNMLSGPWYSKMYSSILNKFSSTSSDSSYTSTVSRARHPRLPVIRQYKHASIQRHLDLAQIER